MRTLPRTGVEPDALALRCDCGDYECPPTPYAMGIVAHTQRRHRRDPYAHERVPRLACDLGVTPSTEPTDGDAAVDPSTPKHVLSTPRGSARWIDLL